ncbi:proline racemase family protein [Pseudonocardia acaciae]|uniref:proline racemase family protein n=1 Tax=Pseudonocardia acaciae TaxID=551276 RepID=UPI0004902791|nr:proline racemase family protein [Pseudonocardia acaciae]
MRWSRTLTVVGCHAAGEVGRVVTGGVGDVPGETMFDKKLYLERHRDELRRMLLNEPRGSVVQVVNFVLPTQHPEASLGYVIAESEEYPAMSGSNTICTATVLLETGMLPMTEPWTDLALEAPAGLIRLRCRCQDGKVLSVRFTNQPSFAYHLDAHVEVPGHGTVRVDVAWGGMTYALVDAADLGFGLTPDEGRDLCVVGERVKRAAAEQLEVSHPDNPRHAGITQTEFTGPLRREDGVLTSRNAVVVSPGRLDRSPCGTGTSARLAVLHAKGELRAGEEFVHESVIGSRFEARVEETTAVGSYPATITSVAGSAWITDISQVGLDPSDPFPEGYRLSDTWLKPDP